jgi:hypothetical protein
LGSIDVPEIAVATTCDPHPVPFAKPPLKVSRAIVNYALTIEYLETQFYMCH